MSKIKKPDRKDIEKMFERFLEDPFRGFMRNRFPEIGELGLSEKVVPKVDMYEKGNMIYVDVEAPGINKDNINISISDGVLNIKGEFKEEEEVNEDDYYYSERSYGSFSRRLALPVEVEEDKVKARFTDGILKIELPKSNKSKPKEIKVDVK